MIRALSFIAVALSVYGGAHYCIYRNLLPLGIPRPALTLLLWGLAISFPLSHIPGLVGKGKVFSWFNQVSTLWLGVMFLLLVAFGLAWLLQLALRIPGIPGPGQHVWTGGALALAAAMALWGGISTLRGPQIARYTIDRSARYGQHKTCKIIQLSDTHLFSEPTESLFRKAAAMTNKEKPDIICITGDLIDPGITDWPEILATLKSLQAADGIFAVTGNHEYYAGVRKFLSLMEEAGIPVLQNRMQVTAGGIQIAGVNDPGHSGRMLPGQGIDLKQALQDLRPDLPSILLTHQPVRLDTAVQRNVDLILAGHTHGGQIFPFHFLVRLVYKYCSGRYSLGPETNLIVSNGVGWWGPPLRILAPAQIVAVEFKY
jgi:uncharacterized protein